MLVSGRVGQEFFGNFGPILGTSNFDAKMIVFLANLFEGFFPPKKIVHEHGVWVGGSYNDPCRFL